MDPSQHDNYPFSPPISPHDLSANKAGQGTPHCSTITRVVMENQELMCVFTESQGHDVLLPIPFCLGLFEGGEIRPINLLVIVSSSETDVPLWATQP